MKPFPFFVAGRLTSSHSKGVSATIVKLATISVALGIAVMIVAVAILTGFRAAIQEKITAYTGHIRVTGFSSNESFEAVAISTIQKFYPWPASLPPIRHIQQFATKAGLVKTEEQIQGVVLKGAASDFDTTFYHQKLVSGRCLRPNDTLTRNDVMISSVLARSMGFSVGDPLRIWFITGNELAPRGRKLTVCGIYDTGLEEFDKLYLIGHIYHIQRLNGWENDQTGGFEIFLNSFSQMDFYGQALYQLTDYDLDVKTLRQLYPQIFDWLDLQNMNVAVILGLMILVAAMALISVLLVLILEQTTVIGILKALGASSKRIRQIFLIQAARIAIRGIIRGNLLALLLVFVQYKWQLLKLPQEAYYVTHVPVLLSWINLLLINLGAFVICLVILTLPAMIISRISPVKAIRYS
ncbi:MAG: ABC transporter permease [Bacteroidales bacterium]|nr:ABC transporter permease [Bacteroidales bacterium]MDD3666620.1 ABC transporter permease [Bacteroidales bacterium]